MQDLLHLDGAARINLPNALGGNWDWRMTEEQLTSEVESMLLYLTTTYRHENMKMVEKPS